MRYKIFLCLVQLQGQTTPIWLGDFLGANNWTDVCWESFRLGSPEGTLFSGCTWQWIPGTAGPVPTSSQHSSRLPQVFYSSKATPLSVLYPPRCRLVQGFMVQQQESASVSLHSCPGSFYLRGTVGGSEAKVEFTI